MTKLGSKYGHLSDIDPAFAAIEPAVRAGAEQLWQIPLENRVRVSRMGMPLPQDIPKDLDITHRNVPVRDGTEIDIRIYKDKGTPKNAPLFYSMHGGGWVLFSHGMEEIVNRFVAAEAAVVVVSVDYRCAPQFRYPYALNDSFDVLKWCKANADELGINAEKIILGGSSSGANLATVTALKARDEGLTGIIGQVLNIPVTCHPALFPRDKYEYQSWEQNKDAPLLSADNMNFFWEQYLPKPSPDPYHSPLLAESLVGLPPAQVVQVAGYDPLRDEGFAYADALKEAGVSVQLEVFPGLPHGCGGLVPLKDVVTRYTTNVTSWVKKTVAT